MRDLFKKFIGFSLGNWISAALSFFTTPVVSWLISPDDFGRAAMYTLAMNILLLLSVMGLDQAFVRMYYESDKKTLFLKTAIPSLLVASLLAGAILANSQLVSEWLIGAKNEKFSILLALGLVIAVMDRFSMAMVRMMQKALIFSTLRIVQNITSLVVTLLYAFFISRDFGALLAGFIASKSVSPLFVGLKYLIKLPTGGKIPRMKELLLYGFPLIPSSLLTWLFQSLDRMFLRYMTDMQQLGLYSAAFKIVAAMNLIRAGFSTFWAPVAYEHVSKNPEDRTFFERIFETVSTVIFFLGMALAAFSNFVFMILSRSYWKAAEIAPFLVFMPIMLMLSDITGIGVYISKRTYWNLPISAIVTAVNAMGNYILVPLMGAKGAALSTSISYILFFILRTVIAMRFFEYKLNARKITWYTVITFLIASSSSFLPFPISTCLSSALLGVTAAMFWKDIHRAIKSVLK